jgi:hypothetical protein
MIEFISSIPTEVVNAVAVALLIVALWLVARLVNAVRGTELFKQAEIRYGLLVTFVTDAIFQAEFADPVTLAAYEEKSQITGYNKKLLLVFDIVERQLAIYGITVDLETQVAPLVERLLNTNATPDSFTPKVSIDPTALRAQAARIEKARK